MEQETLAKKTNFVPPLCDKTYEEEVPSEFSIAVIGDIHLHASTPKSRIDDYPQTCLQKLAILRRTLIDLNIKYLFCAGDIFHMAKERTDFEYRVIEEFLKFKVAGIKVYVIVGNHDIINDRLDSIEKTSLGILFLTRTIYPFTQVLFKRDNLTTVRAIGTHFPNDIKPVTVFGDYNICFAHKFYESNLDKESLMKKDLEKYGYNLYCLGHDHVVYDLEKVPTKDGVVSIVRPGSFTRGTAHNYNTKRSVYFDEIKVSTKVEVVRHTLPVKPPEEVFPASVIDKVNSTNIKDVSQQFAELITQMYAGALNTTSVYTILDESPVDERIKNRIISYLEAHGIFRKENVVAVLN